MFDHEVDEDGPEVCAFRVARQDFVKHGATFLCITITELQLSELADDIHTWEEAWQYVKVKTCGDAQLGQGNRTVTLT